MPISHLLFADDVLLFSKEDVQSAVCIREILSDFADMSGLQANISKSSIFFSAECQYKSTILEMLGFQEGCFPITYLGMPLSSKRISYSACKPLLDRISRRVNGWKTALLSYAGRLQLIK